MTNASRKCVVIHNGSCSTVAGFSNMELPKCIIPSSYVKRNNDEKRIFGTFEMLDETEKNESTSNVYTLIDGRGYPYNWEDLEAQWRYIYEEHLKVSPAELPLVISVPASNGDTDMKIMEKFFDLAFNKLKVPILQILIEPLAIALSMGKSSALVVDIGARGCNVTPIVDGTVVKSGVMKSKFGGDFLDYQITNSEFFNKEYDATNLSSCEMWFSSNTWLQQFKSTMLQVSDKNYSELERYYELQRQQQQQQQQAFPNFALNPLTQKKNFLFKKSKTVTLELRDSYKLAESLFEPKDALKAQGESQVQSHSQPHLQQPASNIGLSELMSKSIRKAGAGVSSTGTLGGGGTGASLTLNEKGSQHNTNASSNSQLTNGVANPATSGITSEQVYSLLLTNVIITGATSLIAGMEQRIINDLSIRFPQYKLTTYANQIMMDRKVQSWIAMNSMSNLPNWELGKWYTKQDFDLLKQSQSHKN
ncbi:hypothetical protein HG535_0B05300 [Zygotorulaspora mrakii]|uniref:Actin-related protein 7 n=1 Tax=Zygotorulaspora mrakii TaxID=42260 RepID=A0A7H9AYK6_ZYGMR|nr:uncharacterized protein HG535_0B05300 [Zygotorulaspora mrakii]QLG71488.1 hypothetical protein HG535_0B05300 [Zygotorulaspora mrakii]